MIPLYKLRIMFVVSTVFIINKFTQKKKKKKKNVYRNLF
jgi:hypothetical protein